MCASVCGLLKFENSKPTLAAVSGPSSCTMPPPLPEVPLGGTSCPLDSAAMKVFGPGEGAPAESVSVIVRVAVPGLPKVAPTGLDSGRPRVSLHFTQVASVVVTGDGRHGAPAAKPRVPEPRVCSE